MLENAHLAATAVVWKHNNCSDVERERLPLVRSCARLGKAAIVTALVEHNLDSAAQCEEVILDAVRGDKSKVSEPLPSEQLLGI